MSSDMRSVPGLINGNIYSFKLLTLHSRIKSYKIQIKTDTISYALATLRPVA